MYSYHPASLPVLRLRISNRPAARQIETSFTHHKMVWVWNKQEAGVPLNSQSPRQDGFTTFLFFFFQIYHFTHTLPMQGLHPPAGAILHLHMCGIYGRLKMIPSSPYKLTSSVQPDRRNTKPKYRNQPPPPLLQLVLPPE